MKIQTLHCATCGEQITDAGWRSIFGSIDGCMFSDGLEPTYQCCCDGRAFPAVYFKGIFTKEQLEASMRGRAAFFKVTP